MYFNSSLSIQVLGAQVKNRGMEAQEPISVFLNPNHLFASIVNSHILYAKLSEIDHFERNRKNLDPDSDPEHWLQS